MYFSCHDFVDHITHIDSIKRVVCVDPEYLNGKKTFRPFRYSGLMRTTPSRINVCYVINDIMTPEEQGDFSVRRTFLEKPENQINKLVIRTESSNYNPYF